MIRPSPATLALPPGAARERHSLETRLDVELAQAEEARDRGDRAAVREHLSAAMRLSAVLRRFDAAQAQIRAEWLAGVSAPGGVA